jgi:hypothetical protein
MQGGSTPKHVESPRKLRVTTMRVAPANSGRLVNVQPMAGTPDDGASRVRWDRRASVERPAAFQGVL